MGADLSGGENSVKEPRFLSLINLFEFTLDLLSCVMLTK